MAYGTASLSRLDCTTCKETTLHKYGKCIHCGTQLVPPRVTGVRPRWNSNAEKGVKQ